MADSSPLRPRFKVVLEHGPAGGFLASVPAIPGCQVHGATLDQVRANVRRAIARHVRESRNGGFAHLAPVAQEAAAVAA